MSIVKLGVFLCVFFFHFFNSLKYRQVREVNVLLLRSNMPFLCTFVGNFLLAL